MMSSYEKGYFEMKGEGKSKANSFNWLFLKK